MTKLFKYQRKGILEISRFNGRALLADEMGLGKAQPLSARILTPDGWTTMEKIRVGQSVIGSDGKSTKVTGVYPQGQKTVFEIEFQDGSTTQCTSDHLWLINSALRKWQGLQPRIWTLKEILKRGLHDKNGNSHHFIPMVQPIHFRDRTLPLHPYLLGYLIANGCLLRSTPGVSIPDEETVIRLITLIPKETELKWDGVCAAKIVGKGSRSSKNYVTECLRDLGLMGHYSYEKFIPRLYKFNSLWKRIRLLQGLMDGDGWVGKKDNHLEYNTTSTKLADDVVELVESLGGTVKLNLSETPYFTYKGKKKIGRPCYRLTICLHESILPFKLRRKANVYHPRKKYLPTRSIQKIEKVGKSECQCISVENPNGLYITDDYIVTHNTAQALIWSNWMESYPTVVVCPAFLKTNWERECRKWLKIRPHVLSGKKVTSNGQFFRPKITIVNFDILGNWLEWIKRIGPKLLIVDEVQYVKSRRAKRSKYVKKLSELTKYMIAISGTPLTNRPPELWSILNMLQSDTWGTYNQFCNKFSNWTWTPFGMTYKGPKALPELHRKLKMQVMIRRLKSDVLKELPDKQRVVVPLEIENYKEYQNAETDFLGWLTKVSPGAARNAVRAQGLVKLGYLRRLAAKLKLNRVIDWLNTFLEESDGKLVIFGIHHNTLNPLHERFPKSVLVTGKTNQKQRWINVDQFQSKGDTRLFLGNIQAAGVGLNLTAASCTCTVEIPWTPGEATQAEDRVHRIGQKSKTTHYYLVGERTIESNLIKIIQDKQETLSGVLDGNQNKDSLDIFDQLTRMIERRNNARATRTSRRND
jgi:SNF2-related domain/Helicase conserved C-terminal domain/LAGLIDADG-like domain